ncbi:retrovirus-related pol polyprotein from transposon TNT 1-94, partial [Tanacetum coccineum]
MEFESKNSGTTAKLPIVKLSEYEMWVIRIKQYFQIQDYALWEVIDNGDSWMSVPQTTQENGTLVTKMSIHITAEEKTNKKNDVKARGLLLMALPNEHKLTFSQYPDAKSMFVAIETRFREDLNSNFLSSLPPEWNTLVVVWMNKPEVETMSIDDLYNNFKIIEQKVKKSVGTNSGAQNLAFMTAPSTSSTIDANTASPQSLDLEQIHEDDLEAIDLKWHSTKKQRRPVSEIKNNIRSKETMKDIIFKEAMLEYKLVVVLDWKVTMAEEQFQQTPMAFFPLKNLGGISDSENDVSFSEKFAVHKREVTCKDYEINVLKSEFEKVKQEKDGIDFKIEKFDKASKDLDQLLGSQIIDKSKKGLGYSAVPPPHPLIYNRPKKLDLPKQAQSTAKRPFNKQTALTRRFVHATNRHYYTGRPKAVNIARSYTGQVNAVRVKWVNAIKSSTYWVWRPTKPNGASLAFKRHNYIDARGRSKASHNMMIKDLLTVDMLLYMTENFSFYLRKQHSASSKSKVLNLITMPLFMLYMDLFGPTFVSSLMHKKCCLVVTDDYSRFTWVFFLTAKDETKKKSIKRECSVARTPQQNGVAERRNRTLIKAARTMLADSKLLTTFWAEAVSTACYVQNRVLVVKPHNKTPYELFRGFKPALSFMRPFGCHVTILNTLDSLGKFDGKSDEGFFVRYSLSSKAFRAYNTRTRMVEENLHIRFLENKPMIEGNGPKWLFDINSLTQSINYVPVTADTSYFDSPTKYVDNSEPKTTDDAQKQVEDGPNNVNSEQDKFADDSSPKDVNIARQHVNTASPDVNTSSLKLNVVGPSVKTASSNEHDSPEDMFTMGEELLQFKLQQVWILVDLPNGKKAIRTKWVFRNKKDEMGIVIRNKARLVAQGHRQEE